MHSHIAHIWDEIQVRHHVVQFLRLSTHIQRLVVLHRHLTVVKQGVRTLGPYRQRFESVLRVSTRVSARQ